MRQRGMVCAALAIAAALTAASLTGCSSGGLATNRTAKVIGEGPTTLAVRITDGTPLTFRLEWIGDDGSTRTRAFTATRRKPIDLLAGEMRVYDITLAAPCCPETEEEPEAREKQPRIIGEGPTMLKFGIDAGATLRVRVLWTGEDGATASRSFRVTETRSVHLRLDTASRYEIRLRRDC